MTNDEMRIAVAKSVGWKFFGDDGMGWCEAPNGSPVLELNIPDYPSDLNAIQEAVIQRAKLKPHLYSTKGFSGKLEGRSNWLGIPICELTARDWAEEFLFIGCEDARSFRKHT